jgi:hypothetical protein
MRYLVSLRPVWEGLDLGAVKAATSWVDAHRADGIFVDVYGHLDGGICLVAEVPTPEALMDVLTEPPATALELREARPLVPVEEVLKRLAGLSAASPAAQPAAAASEPPVGRDFGVETL